MTVAHEAGSTRYFNLRPEPASGEPRASQFVDPAPPVVAFDGSAGSD